MYPNRNGLRHHTLTLFICLLLGLIGGAILPVVADHNRGSGAGQEGLAFVVGIVVVDPKVAHPLPVGLHPLHLIILSPRCLNKESDVVAGMLRRREGAGHYL